MAFEKNRYMYSLGQRWRLQLMPHFFFQSVYFTNSWVYEPIYHGDCNSVKGERKTPLYNISFCCLSKLLVKWSRYLGSIRWITGYYFLAQVWPKRFKSIYEAGAMREKMADILNTVFAKRRKFTISICKPCIKHGTPPFSICTWRRLTRSE